MSPVAEAASNASLVVPEGNGFPHPISFSFFAKGILDFDAVTRDRVDPSVYDEPRNSGDHLHPGTIGGGRMAKEAFRVLTAKR
ncbi:MAG: hypothetical protein IJ001_05865 [Oscillospiraceae bacterium]|nr:hypothetical protein [Oscillospiraceae bacterium]